MKLSKSLRPISAAEHPEYGTKYYGITLDDALTAHRSTGNIWVYGALLKDGFNALNIADMWGSKVFGNTLYVCDTDGEDIKVGDHYINPETALEEESLSNLQEYIIENPTDKKICDLISEYELDYKYLDIDEIARTLLDDPSISFIELYNDYSDIAYYI